MEMMRRFDRLSKFYNGISFFTCSSMLGDNRRPSFRRSCFSQARVLPTRSVSPSFRCPEQTLCQLFHCSLCMRVSYSTNSNLIRAQLQVLDSGQFLQTLDPGDFVLHKENLGQLLQMRDILDMFDLVEAQIQAGQVMELLQALDVGDEVIVEIEFGQTGGDIWREVDA